MLAQFVIKIADGTSKNCAITVTACLLPASHTTVRRNYDSSIFRSITSSVMPDICGSIKTAIKKVAPPLIIDESVLYVTRTLGSSASTYRGANTPTVHNAVAITFMVVIEMETPQSLRKPVTLAGLGRLADVLT